MLFQLPPMLVGQSISIRVHCL